MMRNIGSALPVVSRTCWRSTRRQKAAAAIFAACWPVEACCRTHCPIVLARALDETGGQVARVRPYRLAPTLVTLVVLILATGLAYIGILWIADGRRLQAELRQLISRPVAQ